MRAFLQQPRSRRVLATWLALYPLLTGMLWALETPLSHLPLPLRTLSLTVVLVPALAYVFVPAVLRLLDRLFPSDLG